MKPTLKRLHSPDIQDLKNANISAMLPFEVFVEAMFGPEDAEGEESFGFMVCNDLWLLDHDVKPGDLPSHYLVVKIFDYDLIVGKLRDIALRCEGANWSEVAHKLSEFGLWEFDGYQP